MRLAVTLKYFIIIILVNWGYWLDLCWLVSNSTTCIRFVNSQLVYPCRLGFVNRFRDYLNNWLQSLPSWQSTLRRSAFQRDGKWVMWFWMKRKLQSSPFLYSTRKWLPDVWSFLSIFLQFQFGYVRRFRVNCYCFTEFLPKFTANSLGAWDLPWPSSLSPPQSGGLTERITLK